MKVSGSFHRLTWLQVHRAWWWRETEVVREVYNGRREYFFGHRCPQRRAR